jgi:hypothetical protein
MNGALFRRRFDGCAEADGEMGERTRWTLGAMVTGGDVGSDCCSRCSHAVTRGSHGQLDMLPQSRGRQVTVPSSTADNMPGPRAPCAHHVQATRPSNKSTLLLQTYHAKMTFSRRGKYTSTSQTQMRTAKPLEFQKNHGEHPNIVSHKPSHEPHN